MIRRKNFRYVVADWTVPDATRAIEDLQTGQRDDVEGVLRATPQQVELDMSAELLEDGKSIRSRRWQDRIPRRLV